VGGPVREQAPRGKLCLLCCHSFGSEFSGNVANFDRWQILVPLNCLEFLEHNKIFIYPKALAFTSLLRSSSKIHITKLLFQTKTVLPFNADPYSKNKNLKAESADPYTWRTSRNGRDPPDVQYKIVRATLGKHLAIFKNTFFHKHPTLQLTKLSIYLINQDG
jgi:hypothetical protein